ncbi:MAG: GNAT family N-acetyltransferase, partial [Flavisolibacter sp.]
ATIDDIPNLLQLINSAYRGEEAKKVWTHESNLIEGDLRTDAVSLEEMMGNPNAIILKYIDNNQLRGCVYLEKKQERLYLGLLSVSPDAQAKGIGKKLLHAAEKHAMKNNCSIIEMTVISARSELIAWYQRKGYVQTNQTRPFHNNERFGVPVVPIEFVVMEKKVSGVW